MQGVRNSLEVIESQIWDEILPPELTSKSSSKLFKKNIQYKFPEFMTVDLSENCPKIKILFF
jgi:hypothetical protein